MKADRRFIKKLANRYGEGFAIVRRRLGSRKLPGELTITDALAQTTKKAATVGQARYLKNVDKEAYLARRKEERARRDAVYGFTPKAIYEGISLRKELT